MGQLEEGRYADSSLARTASHGLTKLKKQAVKYSITKCPERSSKPPVKTVKCQTEIVNHSSDE